jgi:hypothetical protein
MTASSMRLSAAGVAAFRLTREALYVLDDGGPRPVVAVGEEIPDFGAIASLGGFAIDGDTAAVFATDPSGRNVIAVHRQAALRKVVAENDPSPTGGGLELEYPDSLLLRGGTLLFVSGVRSGDPTTGLFRVDVRTGTVRVVAKNGDTTRRGVVVGDLSFGSFAFLRRGVAFTAEVEPEGAGLFVRRGRRLMPLAVTGERARGGGTFTGIGAVAASGRRLVVQADLGSLDARSSALFRARRGRLERVFAGGIEVPGGGTYRVAWPVGFSGRSLALVGYPTLGGTGLGSGIFLLRAAKATPLALEGAPAPIGGTYGTITDVSTSETAVVFGAYLEGDAPVPFALFEVSGGRG